MKSFLERWIKMWRMVNAKLNHFFEADLTIEQTKELMLFSLFFGIFGVLLAFNVPLGWWL